MGIEILGIDILAQQTFLVVHIMGTMHFGNRHFGTADILGINILAHSRHFGTADILAQQTYILGVDIPAPTCP